jgi:hypothetical protein
MEGCLARWVNTTAWLVTKVHLLIALKPPLSQKLSQHSQLKPLTLLLRKDRIHEKKFMKKLTATYVHESN